MVDLFPLIYATLKADDYFVTDLQGFKDSQRNFKLFDGDEAPTTETPFITVDILPGGQDQRTDWHVPIATFHVTGKDTDSATLWDIANEIKSIFTSAQSFSDGTNYQIIGSVEFSTNRNPVTEHRIVSVALQFGLV